MFDVPKMYLNKKLTSEEWYNLLSEIRNFKIIDPDGWDRQNFQYSWYEEPISWEEFYSRVAESTIRIKE